jgi:predicted amidohydrolase
MSQLSVGAVQMNSILGDKVANLERAQALLTGAAPSLQIACLPEMFSTGYNLEVLGDDLFELAEPIPGPTTKRLASLAQQLDLAIIAGIVEGVEGVTGLIYDTVILLSRSGELVGRYRKSHLHPTENRYFAAGQRLPVYRVDGFTIGIAICFEHAFPQIFTTLALRGAQVVFNPSAVPVGYGYLQDVRIPARAQDNQIFVAAVNHVGAEGDVQYCGRSQIANPRGEVVALAGSDEGDVVAAELPLDLISNQRRQEPIFRGFRPELYEPTPDRRE